MSLKKYSIPAGIALSILIPGAFAYADHSSEPQQPVEVHAEVQVMPVSAAVTDCTLSSDVWLGSRSEAVECLQRALIAEGFLNLSMPTGYFGDMTNKAVREWQEHKGLPATGYFGALSRAAFGGAGKSAEVAPMAHAHEPVDVSKWPATPSVTILVHKDAMSGYNLEITPVNFRFAPEHVNGVVVPNEGHTHLYINGKKITRVYGPWLHVAPELLVSGDNEVLVTLNANDHSDLALGGLRIEAKTTVTK